MPPHRRGRRPAGSSSAMDVDGDLPDTSFGRGAARGAGAAAAPAPRRSGGPQVQQQQQQPVIAEAAAPSVLFGLKLSNLHYNLTESEIRELFYEFTTVVSARLGFDNAGRSTGVATVLFTSKVEADKAYTWCSNLTIDGEPIKVEEFEHRPAPSRRAARAGAAAAAAGSGGAGGGAAGAAGKKRNGGGARGAGAAAATQDVFSRLGPVHVLQRLGSRPPEGGKPGVLAPGLASRLGPAGGVQARLGPAVKK